MWTISSNDVQQAKDWIDRRRIEIETRYAEEKKVLEAERAAIETLERSASEFAHRHFHDAVDSAPPTTAGIEPEDQAAPAETEPKSTESGLDAEGSPMPAAEMDPAGGGETNLSFDILKPGSRWRLNRAARLLNPDGTPTTPSAS